MLRFRYRIRRSGSGAVERGPSTCGASVLEASRSGCRLDVAKPALELLQHLLRVLVACSQKAFGQCCGLCATPLVDELLTWSLSALMPPPSVTQRIRLESFNPRRSSNSSSDLVRSPSPLPRSPGGAFSLHGPRRARPRTPDRRGGPCVHREERKLQFFRAVVDQIGELGRKPCLSPRTCEQTFPEAPPSEKPPRFLSCRFSARKQGARQGASGHRHNDVDSPICEARTT